MTKLIERLEATSKDIKALPRGHILYGRITDELDMAAARLRKLEAVRDATKRLQETWHPDYKGRKTAVELVPLMDDIDESLAACGDD